MTMSMSYDQGSKTVFKSPTRPFWAWGYCSVFGFIGFIVVFLGRTLLDADAVRYILSGKVITEYFYCSIY